MPKFKELVRNKVKLTPEERAMVMRAKAVWHFNGGSPSPAVWKSLDKAGKVTYVTNTHRAMATAPTVKGAIGKFKFIKTTASEEIEEIFEKLAKQQILFHASPVQDIKKFRKSEDTSGNNKGEIIFASKDKSFAGAFGLRWNDSNASLALEQTNKKPPTEKNFEKAVLKVTKDVDLDAPASLYELKGDFKDLRHPDDIEKYTNKDVKIVSEHKFESYKDLAKACGVEIKKVSDRYIDKQLETRKSIEPITKNASDEHDFDKDGKIPALEKAFSNSLEKKVAYMIATSHEYKKPNVEAALAFVKNYDWTLATCKLSDMEGINKPVDEAKVADMVKNMKVVKPFIVVNQFHGIRPQTHGKKFLVDGHHRKIACERQGKTIVGVYKGTYTGNAEKTTQELKNLNIGTKILDKSKTYAVDFDGTIVENAFPKIGAPKEKIIKFLRKIKSNGGKIFVWTCRSGQGLADAIKFLKDNNVPYDYVNENPKGEFGSRKIYADYYIDDRAVNVEDIENDKIAGYINYTMEKVADISKALYSSDNMSWGTPQKLFDQLNKEFHFNTDVCSSDENAKVKHHYTEKDDGLKQNWKGTVFMNPPYGKHIRDWMKKAYDESRKGTTVVTLIPARTDTRHWHDYAMKASEIRLIKGRLKYSDGPTPSPFPSAIIVFKKGNEPLKLSMYDPKAEQNKIDSDKVASYIHYTIEKMAVKQDNPSTHINRIQRAGTNKKMIHMNYTDKKGETTERLVEPYEIRGADFFGYDPAKESIRRFKVERINHVKVTDVKFNPRWDIKVGDYVPKKRKGGNTNGQTDII